MGPRAWRACQGGLPEHPHGDPARAQRRRWVDHQYVLGHGLCRQSHLAGLFDRLGHHHDLYQSAALQYARDNIRINSVHPGYADTPLTQKRFSDPAARQVLLDRTPMGRLDTARGVLFLASDESSWVTGSELVIDGGMTAQ
jgi:hypothetical protein